MVWDGNGDGGLRWEKSSLHEKCRASGDSKNEKNPERHEKKNRTNRTRNTRRHREKHPQSPPDLVPFNPQCWPRKKAYTSRFCQPVFPGSYFPNWQITTNGNSCLPVAKVATWPTIGQPFFPTNSHLGLSQPSYVLMAHKLISQFPLPSLPSQLREIFGKDTLIGEEMKAFAAEITKPQGKPDIHRV